MDHSEIEPHWIDLVVRSLYDVQVTRYLGVQVLLYDHLLTLPDEVEYVWPAKNTGAKIMFLLLRYMVPFFITIHTIFLSGFSGISNGCRCRGWLAFSTYIGWFSILISNFLVLLRIYTIIPRNYKLVVWTFGFFVVMQVTSLLVITWTVVNMTPLIAFNSRMGVCAFTERPNIAGLWVVGLAFEIAVFATTCWNALDRPRGTSDSPVLKMLCRDALRTANTVIAVTARSSLLFVGVLVIWAGATITTSRLIINSRKTAQQAVVEAQQVIADVQARDSEEAASGPSESEGSSSSLVRRTS
ncbi:hypothetical protein B0H17DRAFT_1035782 [Mycena rosella]|uniref:DUF6533 domain-containing protein n=1 Tax=Mycena rosella TaxID=1033263 RepID=A0AAD7GVN0_MYCRO|nr:hypothetical protein B0H17DRAFT_1035782 [Mycena rosella]